MIIIKSYGGLGNQMFQYAFGRALAVKYNIPFVLFYDERSNSTSRLFELADFKIASRLIRADELAALAQKMKNRQLMIIREKNYLPEQELDIRQDYYFDGYWQSEKHFIACRDTILQDFSLIDELVPHTATKRIVGTDAVAVHVRRGDYVSNPYINRVHGTCSAEYYLQAMRKMQETVKSPVYYVFSDDIAWAREHLSFFTPATFVDPGEKASADMSAMSLCKHFIIANSSFSWWGAWLGRYPEKKVIAPRQWFGDERLLSPDLLPRSWMLL